MKILAIDTSTEACSVALHIDDDVKEEFEVVKQSHTDRLLPMIESLMAEAEIASVTQFDAIAFARGPGSFTGIRIGTGVVQGIALGADLPVAPVSTLAAIAQGVRRNWGARKVISAIDARMEEIYWGAFQLNDHNLMVAAQPECVAKPHSLPLPEGIWFGAGSAWNAYKDELSTYIEGRINEQDGSALPHAQDIATLAVSMVKNNELVAAEQAQPVYLRNEVAWKKIIRQ